MKPMSASELKCLNVVIGCFINFAAKNLSLSAFFSLLVSDIFFYYSQGWIFVALSEKKVPGIKEIFSKHI